MAIKSLLDKLNEAITDFSSLEVATFTKSTGDKVEVDMGDGVSTNDIFKNIRAGLAQEELVGYVKFEVDGDTVAYVNSNDVYAEVLEYHKEMIKAGQQTRKNIYDTIVGLFKKGS